MKCIVCHGPLLEASEYKTCVPCLENTLEIQGDLVSLLNKQIIGLHEASDLAYAQTQQLLEVIKAKATPEEYFQILQRIHKNPYNLEDTDIC